MTTEEVTFSRGPARRPQPTVSDPLLQWATGLQTRDRRVYAGWFTEAGKDAELDEWMQIAQVEQVTIKHGGGNMVTHWALPTASLFVLCDGVQSLGEMKRTEERYGIAFGWKTLEGGRQQSQLRCRVMLRQLMELGCAQVFTVSLKGTITGDFIDSLMVQYDVLDAVAAIRQEKGLPQVGYPFYAASLTIGPGGEVTRGSNGAQKEITPPRCMALPPYDAAYIKSVWARKEWVQVIEAEMDATVAWSKTTSQLIASGEAERQEWE